MCSLRLEAVSGPRWFTIASAADQTGSFSLCLRIRLPYCALNTAIAERERDGGSGNKGSRGGGGKKLGRKGRKKEAENDRTITVEGDHHHIRVFHEKATSGALMGNMQMYANVCWMGRPEAQWEIKALRDGEGCGEG